MDNRYKNRYEKPRIPTPPGISVLKTYDAVMSYIAKQQAFAAPRLVWEDRDSDGRLVAHEEYGIKGEQFAPQGVKKCYVLRDYSVKKDVERGMHGDREYDFYNALSKHPSFSNLYVPLFIYDYQTEQWYRNARPSYRTEDHPCSPCVTPDKAIIPLPDPQLRYLMRHGVMGLMEAKVNGHFSEFRESRVLYTDLKNTWIFDFEDNADMKKWFEGAIIKIDNFK